MARPVGPLRESDGAGLPPVELNELVAVLRAQLARVLDETHAAPADRSVLLYLWTQQGRVAECLSILDRISLLAERQLGQRRRLEAGIAAARGELAAMRAAVAAAKADEQRARYFALHDSITTLPNERHLRARLDQAIRNCESHCETLILLYVDLDGFKSVNDTYGHDIGNDVLRIVSARLHRTLRAEDIVGRVGGDEFVCILTGSPKPEQAARIACMLIEKVGAAATLGGITLHVRSSIGLAVYPGDGTTAAALLKSADSAMYRSKRAKSGPVFCGDGVAADPGSRPRTAGDILQ